MLNMYGMTHFDLAVLSGKLVKNTRRVIRYSRVGTVCGQANFERFRIVNGWT